MAGRENREWHFGTHILEPNGVFEANAEGRVKNVSQTKPLLDFCGTVKLLGLV